MVSLFPRRDYETARCRTEVPQWYRVMPSHSVRCFLFDQAKGTTRLPVNHTGAEVTQERVASSSQHAPAPYTSLLQTAELRVHFPIQKGVLKRVVGYVRAVDGVSHTIEQGKTLALVGESGCGKTTLGKAILQLIRPTGGSVKFEGNELTRLKGCRLRRHRSNFQIIFQDPFSSMNPRIMDDFIITGESLELLRDEVLVFVKAFLAQRGLSLSEEKTRITHIREGFDFLGQNVRKYGPRGSREADH